MIILAVFGFFGLVVFIASLWEEYDRREEARDSRNRREDQELAKYLRARREKI